MIYGAVIRTIICPLCRNGVAIVEPTLGVSYRTLATHPSIQPTEILASYEDGIVSREPAQVEFVCLASGARIVSSA